MKIPSNHAFDSRGLWNQLEPTDGKIRTEHLLVARQWSQIENGLNLTERSDRLSSYKGPVARTLKEIAGDARLVASFANAFGMKPTPALLDRFGHLTPWHLSFTMPQITPEMMRLFDTGAESEPLSAE